MKKPSDDFIVMANAWHNDDGKCHYCGKKLNPWIDTAFDHKTPKKHGGAFTDGNVVISCIGCNSRKSDTPYSFYIKFKRRWKGYEKRCYIAMMESINESGSQS